MAEFLDIGAGEPKPAGPAVMRFPSPEPRRKAVRLAPFFLPHAGCPHRCRFCAQAAQSGVEPFPLAQAPARLAAFLDELSAMNSPGFTLGLFGGTFTSLPNDLQRELFGLIRPHLDSGLLSGVRASTRPDACDPAWLAELAGLGLTELELGVPSFSDVVLHRLGRGHTGRAAAMAAAACANAGIALGLQMMPGSPGSSPDTDRMDAELACAMNARFVRLSPCLALSGTPLATDYESGAFRPLSLAAAVGRLARSTLVLWGAGVPVARYGLAPQETLDAATVAGPTHPSLGSMVRGDVMFRFLAAAAAYFRKEHGRAPSGLLFPARLQGEILGHKGSLAPKYARLGLAASAMRGHEEEEFVLS